MLVFCLTKLFFMIFILNLSVPRTERLVLGYDYDEPTGVTLKSVSTVKSGPHHHPLASLSVMAGCSPSAPSPDDQLAFPPLGENPILQPILAGYMDALLRPPPLLVPVETKVPPPSPTSKQASFRSSKPCKLKVSILLMHDACNAFIKLNRN